jgi:L-lactate utilization protein LutC
MKNLCKIKIFKKNRKLSKVMENDIIGVLEPQLMHFNYDKIKFKKFKEKLFNQLIILSKNKKVILRTHPRYSAFNLNEFNNKNLVIQSGKDEKAEKFLNKCNILIGTASAMLVDASMMGIKVLVCKNDLVDVLSKYHFFYFKKNVKIINVKNLNKYV